jgi:hypothetical protein
MKKSKPELRSSWNKLKNDMKNMLTKHEGMLSLKLGNSVVEHSGVQDAQWIRPMFHY